MTGRPEPVPAGCELRVPVAGGDLAVTHWPATTTAPTAAAAGPVIALHGITANGLALTALARTLTAAGHDVYAPDLRGRAGSRALPGPYGLAAHAGDLLALLDHLGLPSAPLIGHSMGGFVAALAAARHPGRFPRVVLVDGGIGFPAPAGTDIDALLEAVIGPAMRRLAMTFPDRDAYRAFFRNHPALARHWGPDVQCYVDRDLTGSPPALRSGCVLEAVRADGSDVLTDPETLGAAARLTVPATLLYAERGLLDEPQALYDAGRLAACPVPARPVPDTNHYSILLTPAATGATAEALASLASRTPPAAGHRPAPSHQPPSHQPPSHQPTTDQAGDHA